MIYKEFVTKQEQQDLISWAYSCKLNLNPNLNGPHRFFNQLENIQKNRITDDIKQRIIDKFDLSTFENETIATIELNRYRVKTESEIVREAKILKDEFSKYIKKGRPLKGEVRDGKNLSIIEVSKRLGVSTTKLKKLLSIH